MSADKVTTENAIFKYNDIVIYSDDINLLCDEYINSLPAPDMIYKSACFNGLLDYIYRQCLKRIINISKNNGKYNYTVLDNIFNDIYLPLCYRYNITPTVIQFTSLVKIDNAHLSDLRSGVYRTSSANVNPSTTQIVKTWYKACESATIGKVLNESSIGGMFIAKAVYGYSDAQTIKLETVDNDMHETAAEIAARHDTELLPEMPEI